MRALLLAAGLGTRLRPITDKIPKCLVLIHDKPLLLYWLELLLRNGIESVLINTHYLPDRVQSFVMASEWRSRITLVHEDVLLGTGGTILKNHDYFCGRPFLVGHADNLTRFDLPAFRQRHQQRPAGTVVTMMTFTTDDPGSCGIVDEDEHGIIRGFYEKVSNPPGNHANAAVYIFEPEVMEFLASLNKPVIDISTEVIPAFLGRICTFHNSGYHRDIGTMESLSKAEAEFKAG